MGEADSKFRREGERVKSTDRLRMTAASKNRSVQRQGYQGDFKVKHGHVAAEVQSSLPSRYSLIANEYGQNLFELTLDSMTDHSWRHKRDVCASLENKTPSGYLRSVVNQICPFYI